MSDSGYSSFQKLVSARRAYFDNGLVLEGVIDQGVYRSWDRCRANNRGEEDAVVFAPVSQSLLHDLSERNNVLLEAASGPLDDLAKAVCGAGYVVLLTDNRGVALSVTGALTRRDGAMWQAHRKGVDLSESIVGTSAMACAMAERRAMNVFGAEHYFAANRIFYCSAAPIIGPTGEALGSVDITRATPKPNWGAMSLVSQCAGAIERELFRGLHSFLTIVLSWHAAARSSQEDLMISFGADGEVVALNDNARRFFGIVGQQGGLRFEDLFEGRFPDCARQLRKAGNPIPIRLQTGLCLMASSELQDCSRASGLYTDKKTMSVSDESSSSHSIVEFGDPGIDQQLISAICVMANRLPILVRGETGTGKEVVANALHARSSRSRGPFIAINCAAIPQDLIEGELFGHVEGAYTGARRGGATGKIEAADGGTLFLDEIGDMPLSLQARLLRVLETREITRLGTSIGRKVDFQLVCATHQDIGRAVANGCFRQDLYYRINGFTVYLPSLRHRKNIARIIQALLESIAGSGRKLAPQSMALLEAYPWPGNVRELRHALTYAHSTAPSAGDLLPEHLPEWLLTAALTPVERSTRSGAGMLQRMEKEAIRKAMEQAGGRVQDAAELLGVSRATLYRWLKNT